MHPERLRQLRSELEAKKLDACLVSSIHNITYFTNLTNFSPVEREAFLFVTEKQAYIITDGRYATAVREAKIVFDLLEISSKTPLREILENLQSKHNLVALGIEENDLYVNEFRTIKKIFKRVRHFDISGLRQIKSAGEMKSLQKACELGDQAFKYLLSEIKPGRSEKELAWILEKYVKEHQAELSFPTIVAFNSHAAIPHHQTSETILGKNGLILIDMGVKLDNYCSDMTRTVFLGKATTEQKKLYQTVLKAQQKAVETISHMPYAIRKDSKRIKASNIDQVARSYIAEQGYPSIPHSLGHGIGLEVHESPSLSPRSKQELLPGMIFSIEPGIYIPGKMGVRIEDLFALQTTGLLQLTKAPKSIIEL